MRLAAAPVDGAAHEPLADVLAEAFGVPKRRVTIVSGERSSQKRVRVVGQNFDQAAMTLGSTTR